MSQSPEKTIGIIGGSGLYQMPGLEAVEEVQVETPFGDPSDALLVGRLEGRRVAFLSRHGRGHHHGPTFINYRANLHALKQIGCTYVLSVSAVGSMKEEIEPGHMVVIEQFIDRTRHREDSFFGQGCVAHVGFADPVCPVARKVLVDAARAAGQTVHDGGTYLCMEGPAFSTRAESRLYRSWGVEVIGMTNLTEAKLAREAELAYATLALSTDYDCWYEGEEDVSVEFVVATMRKNVANAQAVLRHAVAALDPATPSPAHTALRGAVMSDPAGMSDPQRSQLALLLASQTRYAEES